MACTACRQPCDRVQILFLWFVRLQQFRGTTGGPWSPLLRCGSRQSFCKARRIVPRWLPWDVGTPQHACSVHHAPAAPSSSTCPLFALLLASTCAEVQTLRRNVGNRARCWRAVCRPMETTARRSPDMNGHRGEGSGGVTTTHRQMLSLRQACGRCQPTHRQESRSTNAAAENLAGVSLDGCIGA